MSQLAIEALLEFLLWWTVFAAGYAVLLFAADWLLDRWDEHCTRRETEREQLERIDTEMRASAGRLANEFASAQREIRQVTARKVDRH